MMPKAMKQPLRNLRDAMHEYLTDYKQFRDYSDRVHDRLATINALLFDTVSEIRALLDESGRSGDAGSQPASATGANASIRVDRQATIQDDSVCHPHYRPARRIF